MTIFLIFLILVSLINIGITIHWTIQADHDFNGAFKKYFNRQEDFKTDWKNILLSLVIPIMFNTFFIISMLNNSFISNLLALLIFNVISLLISYLFKQFQSNFGYVIVADYDYNSHKQIKVDSDENTEET